MSTSVEVQSPNIGQNIESNIHMYVDSLRVSSDPNQQLAMLNSYNLPVWLHQTHTAERGWTGDADEMLGEALMDFAIDETSSNSITVRLQALERALERSNKYPATQEDPSVRSLVISARQNTVHSFDHPDGRAYRHLTEALVAHEGLDPTILIPELSEADIDRGGRDFDYNPVLAFVRLNEVSEQIRSGRLDDDALRLAPLLATVQEKLSAASQLPEVANIELREWYHVGKCAKLLAHGDNYRQLFVDILNRGDYADGQYINALGEMSGLVPQSARAYPKRYRAGVEQGLQLVLADTLYGVLHHINEDKETDVELELRSGSKGLPLRLQGEEPHELLAALQTAYRELANVGRSMGWRQLLGQEPESSYFGSTVKVADSEQFSIYRFNESMPFYGQSLTPLATSIYIRSRGSHTYDKSLEYGRPGEGVEASISYVIDTGQSGDTLSEVGKHRGSGDDRRISIRLDREGEHPNERGIDRGAGNKRDPERQQGTLSLDVGSILGNDDWLSTKLGRFLAFGNMLRSDAMGVEMHLNHVTEYFTTEDGDADVFAATAEDLAALLERQRLSVDEIASLYRDRVMPVGRLLKA